MAFDWSQMIGNLMGGAASSLGYGNMAIKKPNGPKKPLLLPSQQAGQDMMDGASQHLLRQQDSMPDTTSLLAPQGTPGNPSGGGPDWKQRLGAMLGGVSFHADGGELDPNKINIVGDATGNPDDMEAIVGRQVIPLNKPGMIQEQLGTTGGHDEQYGLDQTEQGDDRSPYTAQVTPNTADSMSGTVTSPQGSPGNPSGGPVVDPNSEDGLRQQLQQTLQERTKRNPWTDLGVSLVQAGDNWFNHKNEPIKTWAEMKADRKLGSLMPQYQIAKDAQNAKDQKAYTLARMGDMALNRQIQQGTLAERDRYHQGELEQKKQDLINKDNHVRMRLLQTQLNGIKGGFDPTDPKNAAIVKGFGDFNMPLTAKDSKKQVKMIQDADTGAWSVALTDPYSGEQEVRPVTDKEGKQLTTTSPTKVTAEASSGRQDKELDYKRQRDAAMNQYRSAAQTLRQQEFAFRQAGQTDKATAAANSYARLKLTLQQRVNEGKLSQSEADDILNERNGVSAEVGLGDPTQ